ncbi:unnamed protein product [Miscanthus lutarioriparius]|uniref:Uncharacterized protein n=1 Tax=Miscanthus lutarioriparius TaxID=422564 RepID=A0A811SGI5_9POAL|nr:unnamed protein product [Miscanthus lutarioriparius]
MPRRPFAAIVAAAAAAAAIDVVDAAATDHISLPRDDMATQSKVTSSRCTTQAEMGTHTFEIVRYSLMKGMCIGKFVQSDIFTVGGHSWAIRFYPDGVTDGTRMFASVALVLMDEGAEVRAFYDLFLDSELCKTKGLEIQVPPSDLSSILVGCCSLKRKRSVIFSVQGETFPAHKIILATRSPVFKAQLYGKMKETKAWCVTVEDMQPDVFKYLLNFIYTDALPVFDDDIDDDDYSEMIKHLLVAADRYAMDRMKLLCASVLVENLRVDTVATTLAFLDQHNCKSLRDMCIEFMASSNRIRDVMATQGHANLKRTCPSVIVDVLEKTGRCRKI